MAKVAAEIRELDDGRFALVVDGVVRRVGHDRERITEIGSIVVGRGKLKTVDPATALNRSLLSR